MATVKKISPEYYTNLYERNEDFKNFVDRVCKCYGYRVEFTLHTPTAKEYAAYLDDEKRIDESDRYLNFIQD